MGLRLPFHEPMKKFIQGWRSLLQRLILMGIRNYDNARYAPYIITSRIVTCFHISKGFHRVGSIVGRIM